MVPKDLKTDKIQNILYKAEQEIKHEILSQWHLEQPSLHVAIKGERERFERLFPDPVYVKEIPNEYWKNDPHMKHFPWFIVTTSLGPIKIGRRKWVTEIDWSESEIRHDGRELFKDEDVTKESKMVHAWGFEDAKRYILKLMNLG